ncbi:hypothetical protein SE17_00065 [Kouleothrix aurantiaca]|uniref:Uncharacterized protein n=1 Tax=Kouleothrix aurantiaca TaxID=186479 RepID=A0A0P9DYH1_9CHLR|nr:hypothetical protein SE17_00065 [Kouleothrix aurantiaca]
MKQWLIRWLIQCRRALATIMIRWLDRWAVGMVVREADTFYLAAGRALTIAMVDGPVKRYTLVAGDTLSMALHTYAGGEEFPIPLTVALLVGEPAERYLQARAAEPLLGKELMN